MLELLLVRQEEMEQQTGTEGNVKPIGFILMRMMVIASEEWKGGEVDECILTYDEIQLHRCVCGEWLEHAGVLMVVAFAMSSTECFLCCIITCWSSSSCSCASDRLEIGS